MGAIASRGLISLAYDEGNSVSVNVLERNRNWAARLDAEIVVRTPFVPGRCHLAFCASKPEAWPEALNSLDVGEDASWMEMSREASSFVQLASERGCRKMVVEASQDPWPPSECRSTCPTTGSPSIGSVCAS
ncbi:DUF5959 family protein [Streptomyces sp. NPDC099088]|uniref:DUF5959 family protein n=1 Tax=Streptomyces sp. NPDC099088 TaxID=3366101 RepID=UPI00380F5850